MKSRHVRALLLALVTTLTLALFTACDSDEPAKQTFTLPDPNYDKLLFHSATEYAYSLESWARLPEYDTATTDGYGVCLLMTDNGIPIFLMSALMAGSLPVEQVPLDVSLTSDKGEISSHAISLQVVTIDESAHAELIFIFNIPKNTELPQIGTAFNSAAKNPVTLDLSNLPVEELNATESEE